MPCVGRLARWKFVWPPQPKIERACGLPAKAPPAPWAASRRTITCTTPSCPRTKLPEILAKVVDIGQRYDLPIANLFHAGDGNLHPMILFDARQAGILERVMAAGREILTRCIEAGGTITGEHGVGLEKLSYMPLIFSPADLAVMARVRDAIDPSGNLNPAKVLPTAESAHGAVHGNGMPQLVAEGMWV